MNKTKIVNMNARDKYILEKADQGFSMAEIKILLPKEGFKEICRSRIGQIIKENEK